MVKKGIRRQLYNYQNGKCCMCGEKVDYINFTVDHIVARSKGGGSKITNLEGMCGECNRMKRDYHKEHFLQHIQKIYKHNFE